MTCLHLLLKFSGAKAPLFRFRFGGLKPTANPEKLLLRDPHDGEAAYGSVWEKYFIYLKKWRVARFMSVFQESSLIVTQRQFVELKRNLSIPPQFDLFSVHDRIYIDYVCDLTGANVFVTVMYS